MSKSPVALLKALTPFSDDIREKIKAYLKEENKQALSFPLDNRPNKK
jgi:hypothetical protein